MASVKENILNSLTWYLEKSIENLYNNNFYITLADSDGEELVTDDGETLMGNFKVHIL